MFTNLTLSTRISRFTISNVKQIYLQLIWSNIRRAYSLQIDDYCLIYIIVNI